MQKLFLFIIMIFLFAACNSHHGGELTLNNGQKWKVNAEMTPHIAKGHEVLTNYLAQNGTDFQTLAAELKTHNNNLIKSCTMDGKSHDELHKWLHPHMELIGDLEDANSPDEAKAFIAQIKQSFLTYSDYFE